MQGFHTRFLFFFFHETFENMPRPSSRGADGARTGAGNGGAWYAARVCSHIKARSRKIIFNAAN